MIVIYPRKFNQVTKYTIQCKNKCHYHISCQSLTNKTPVFHEYRAFSYSNTGHFHDGVILLQLPEFTSFSFSNSNFVIPGENKEQ